MKLIDLDAKEPYLLDGRYSVGILDNASTVKRPQGEWITHRVAFHLTCSFCGCNLRAIKRDVFEGDYDYNFCPNCGADMRGEEP